MRGLWADRSRLTLLTYALESIMFLDQIWCGDDGACPCQYVFLGTSDSNAVKLPLRHVGCEAIAAECLNFERHAVPHLVQCVTGDGVACFQSG